MDKHTTIRRYTPGVRVMKYATIDFDGYIWGVYDNKESAESMCNLVKKRNAAFPRPKERPVFLVTVIKY